MEIGLSEWRKVVSDGAKTMGIEIGSLEMEQLSVHGRELIKWNRKKNLTAIVDPYDVAIKHFIDSIAPIKWITEKAALLDIGSGGGFPGIPLKIMMPALNVTLIDASRKKVGFLKHVIRTIGLKKITAEHIRAEDLPGPEHIRGKSITRIPYDVIISRALSALDQFAALSMPLLSTNGLIIAMQGKLTSKKRNGIRGLLVNQGKNQAPCPLSVELFSYRLPFTEAERSLVCIRRSKR